MTAIRQFPWTSQPQVSVLLAGTQLTAGIDLAYVNIFTTINAGPTNKLGSIARSGALVNRGTPTGLMASFGNSASNFFTTSWPVIADGSSYTLLATILPNTVASVQQLINGDNATRCFQFRLNSAAFEFLILDTTAAVVATGSFSNAVTAGKPATVLGRCVGATGAIFVSSVFVNGRKGSDGTSTSATSRGITATQTIIGQRSGGSPVDGCIGLVVRWARALSDAEASAVTLNPWQIFEPLPRMIMAPAAAAGGGPGVDFFNPPLRGGFERGISAGMQG